MRGVGDVAQTKGLGQTGIVLAGTALAGIVLVVLLEQFTGLDGWVQSLFYDEAAGGWLIDRDAAFFRLVFYDGPKRLLVGVGVLAVLVALWGAVRSASGRSDGRIWRPALVVALSLAVVPSVVGALKSATHIYCPYHLQTYGGSVPETRLLDRFPADFERPFEGRCFPAGHASGGFALMALGAVARTRRGRFAGYGAGFAMGGAMGFYQMAVGAHFLSHTLVTLLIAVGCIAVLRWLIGASWGAGQRKG